MINIFYKYNEHTRVSQHPISGTTQTAMREKQPTWLSLGEPRERRELAHKGCSESV